MYQVSRITVKKALEILAYRGCILRKPGKGSFVVFESNLEKALQNEDIMKVEEISGENALARGLPQGCLTIGSSGWISMGVVSHARRKLFAIRRFAGRSGYFWVTSVKAKARPMVMLGTAFGYCSFKEYNLSVR